MSSKETPGTSILKANAAQMESGSGPEVQLLNALKSAVRERRYGGESISQALRELGSFYDSKSMYSKALPVYQENINLWKKNQRDRKFCSNDNARTVVKRNLGSAYHDMSLTHKYMENYPEAIR